MRASRSPPARTPPVFPFFLSLSVAPDRRPHAPVGVAIRGFRASPAVDARILCSDPIDPVCPEILKAKGHTVDVPPGDKPIPAAELKKIIGGYDALVVRR